MKFFIPAVLAIMLVAGSGARADDFYVSCKGDNTLAKISGDAISTVATGKSVFYGLAADRFGNLYASNVGGNNILKYASVNGTLSNTPTVFADGLTGPTDIAFDLSGNLYEIESSGNINKFVFSGVALSNKPLLFVNGSPEHANLTGEREPINLAFDQRGNLYVAILIGGILKFTNSPSGLSDMPDAKLFSTVSRARQMAFDRNGNLFTANHMSDATCVYEFPNSPSGLSGTPRIFATGHGLNAPTGVAFDSLGNLYVTNWGFGQGVDILQYPNINGLLSSTPAPYATDFDAPILIVAIKSR